MQHGTQKHLRGLLAGMLCLLLLLAGCGGSEPQPPSAGLPETAEQPVAPQPDPPKDPPAEPEPPAESPAASPAEPEPEEPPQLDYFLLDYASVAAYCAETEGTLVVVKVQAENPSQRAFPLDYTVAALGGITTGNAADGLNAAGVAAAKPTGQLTAWVRTDRDEPYEMPVVAAVESAAAEIAAGKSAIVYFYLFLPEAEGSWKRIDLLDAGTQIGYLTPKPARNPETGPG